MCWIWGFWGLVIIDQKGGGAEDQAGQFWVIEASRPRTWDADAYNKHIVDGPSEVSPRHPSIRS